MNLKPFLFLFLLACLIAPAAAAGGAGTAANPYIIETPAELQSIHNNLGAYYRLANNIDLSDVTWTPIGTISAGFFGELDGNGYKISNLDLSRRTQCTGLFTMLSSGATIKDLTLEDCIVESTAQWTACLTGLIMGSSSENEPVRLQNINVVRCSVSSENLYAGIICGSAVIDTEINGCTITNSHAKCNTAYVGIISGACYSGCEFSMFDCSVDSCIIESIAHTGVGGLCGICYGRSAVSAENCIIENSIVKGNDNVGGLFGRAVESGTSISATGCTITDSTIIATQNYAGGIIGFAGSINDVFFNSCIVNRCSIMTITYAGGICCT